MIIQQEVSSPVITSIGATPSKFKIKASAKAFKILSGFYSEPILAIPRELGANAWDAHVKAKNTHKMFEVHAPNTLEPWFSIRDFGTGLSPEDVDQIYTTYFESTKTSDNDSDGCMGLGSKTPFNYTENFMVTSYYKGTKYVYNCFIDEAGSPNILPVASEPTTEHNGLEIKFGVKITDIQMFTEKVTRAYEPFRFRPVIKGATIVYRPREYSFEGTGWAMRKDASSGPYERKVCRAFMGNYSYPVSYDAVRGYLTENVKDSNVSNRLYTLLQTGNVDFFFNIGDLEVAPNKEQLQYDADHKTAKAICDRGLIALKELRVQVDAQLEVPKTMWQAMSLYVKYNSYNSGFTNLRNIIGDIEIKFNGQTVESGNISVDSVHVKSGLVAKSTDAYKPNKLAEKFNVGVMNYRSHSDKFIIREKGYYTTTEKGDFPIFLYTAEENFKKARVRHYLKTKFPSGNIPDTVLVTDQSPGFKAFKLHCAFLGIPDTALVHVESLPKPPRVPREAKTATTDEINYINVDDIDIGKEGVVSRYYNDATWFKKPNTFNGAETYYYVDFYYADQQWKGNCITYQMNAVLRLIKRNKGLPDGVKIVWGINKKNQHLLKVGKWINLVDLAEKTMKSVQAEYEQYLYLLSISDVVGRLSNIRKIVSDTTFLSHLSNKATIKLFKSFVSINKDISDVNPDTNDLAKVFGFKAKMNSTINFDPKEFEKILKEKYFNVFSFTDHYSARGPDLARLINFIDEKS